MNDELNEAEKILAEKKILLEKYPDKFSLRADVRKWSGIVDKLKRDEVMFECPICLEDTLHKDRKQFQLSEKGTEYAICPFCYHVIKTLRKKNKSTFKVEIQKFEGE